MSEEYVSVFHTPMHEQILPMKDWLEKTIGVQDEDWTPNSPEVLCAQITFKQQKHKRMFDFYAELQGITVYDTLKEYQTAQMLKFRGKVAWMDETGQSNL